MHMELDPVNLKIKWQ